MAKPRETTIHLLRQIRDEMRSTREEVRSTRDDLGRRIDETNSRLEGTNSRLDRVGGTLVDLAEHQRFVVRHLQALTTRDRKIEDDVDALRTRVDAIEKRLDD